MKSSAKSSVFYVRGVEGVELAEPQAGIALSGGGSHGAFAAGIMHHAFDTFLSAGRLPRLGLISGTSTGSLVAGLLTQLYGRFKRGDDPAASLAALKRAYTETTQEQVGRKPSSLIGVGWNLLTKKGVMDITPLRSLIAGYFEETYMAAALEGDVPIPYSCNYIDMVSGQQVHVATDDDAGCGQERMVDAIFASCAQPVVNTPTYVGRVWATDGGVREVVPFREVMRRGCSGVLAVALNEPEVHPAPAFAEGGDHDPLAMIERGLVVMNDEVARDDERLARFTAYLNRAKDQLGLDGVDDDAIARAFPNPGPLVEDIDARPGQQDPYENELYNESALREILLFRFSRRDLPPQDAFTPHEMAKMFRSGSELAADNMEAIERILFVGGEL